jgi:hypothetical protein
MSRSAGTDPTVYEVGGPSVAWRETGGEIVVLDVEGSVYFALNGTGAGLWRLLVAGADRASLIHSLTADGIVDHPRAEADVESFLADLDGEGLLRRRACVSS